MDKNFYTGMLLMGLVLIGYYYFTKPTEAELKKEQRLQDSLKAVRSGKNFGLASEKTASALKTSPKRDSVVIDTSGPFGASLKGNNQMITLENKRLRINISTKGGRIVKAELKGYKTYQGKPLVLVEGDQNVFNLSFVAGGRIISTDALFFKPTIQGNTVILRSFYSPTQYIEYVYALAENSYVLDFKINRVGMESLIPAGDHAMMLNVKNDMLDQEKDIKQQQRYTTVFVRDNQEQESNLKETKDDDQKFDAPIKWLSFKQHFFSMIFIADNVFPAGSQAAATSDPAKPVVKTLSANLPIPYHRQAIDRFSMKIYMGPNQFDVLKSFGIGLEKEIPLGWGPLKIINRYAVLPVFQLLGKLGWNYGITILILTLLLKLVLFPLTYRSYLSTAKMRVIKPEMDEIKKKIGGDDPTRLQQEYMKLYKQAGVNPFGGCLPVLFQMPILYAFFQFFPNSFELRQQKFLFMEDLSTYDSFLKWKVDIPFISSTLNYHLSLMCVLMACTTFIYTLLNNQLTGSTMSDEQKQYKYIGYILPFVSLIFLNNVSAGLNYYYFCANIITFTQQAVIRRFVNDEEIHKKIQENKKRPVVLKKSQFQQKLEDMAKQQRSLAAAKATQAPQKRK